MRDRERNREKRCLAWTSRPTLALKASTPPQSSPKPPPLSPNSSANPKPYCLSLSLSIFYSFVNVDFLFFLLHLIFQISDKTFLVCLISMLIPRSHYCCLFGAILFCFVLSCLFFGASLWFTFRWVKLTLLFGDTGYSDLSVIDLWLRWWSGQRDTHCLNFKRTLNPVKGIVEMTCVLFKDFDIILY